MQDVDKKGFFSKIDNYYDALALIKDTTKALTIIGVLQLITGVFLYLQSVSLLSFSDGLITLACAYAIRRFHSRLAAVVSLLFAFATLGIAAIQHASGSAIFLSLITLWAAGRALEATAKLRGRFASGPAATDDSL